MTRPDHGMALAIVLVLLLGLSLLATAGLGGALAALMLSGFEQQRSIAFEAAEAAISRTVTTGEGIPAPTRIWDTMPPEILVRAELIQDPPGRDDSWPQGFSVGAGGTAFALRHHVVLAEGRAGRGAIARIEQGFVTVVPERGGTP